MKELVISKGASGYMGALFENGKMVELFQEELESISGNIYIGRIERVLETLGGAFVNIGTSKNAFLKLCDLTPSYIENVLSGKKVASGLKILVQVKKDGTKQKGPQVTTKICLAGRFLVYFPVSYAKGISKRIAGKERERLKKILEELREKGEGIIIRTAADGVDKNLIENEYHELKKTWETLVKKFKRARKVKLLLSPPTFLDFLIRERLEKDIKALYTNDPEVAEKAKKAFSVYGHLKTKIFDTDPFDELGIYQKMREITSRKIELESGGEIVIDHAEAMTVIDVNTAASVKGASQRQLILKTNIEAAKEIARQLRLRNIGGIVIIDFITMDHEEDRKKVIEAFKKALKSDRARTEVLGFTKLGLLEMTRRRSSKSITSFYTTSCPVCKGSGSVISQRLVISRIEADLSKINEAKKVKIRLHQSFSGYVTKSLIRKWKNLSQKEIKVEFDWCDPSTYEIKYTQ